MRNINYRIGVYWLVWFGDYFCNRFIMGGLFSFLFRCCFLCLDFRWDLENFLGFYLNNYDIIFIKSIREVFFSGNCIDKFYYIE